MSLTVFNHLENAIESLRSNRMRTLLTITGVTIGIGSIVCVLSLAGGISNLLSAQTAKIKDHVAIVRSGDPNVTSALLSDHRSSHKTNNLTERDVALLDKELPATVVPLAILQTNISSRDTKINEGKTSLLGSNQHLASLANLEMLEGNFVSDESGASIVVGNQLAIDLFGTDKAIGNLVTIREQHFTVTGVLRQADQSAGYLQADFDNSAIVSLSSIKQFTENVAQIQQIAISANDGSELRNITAHAKKLLTDSHKGESDFVILTGTAITQPDSELFGLIVILVASVAGISLLVGGIGIMNIMLVNVAERRREVGIRKAIGATDGHVINQFLVESSIVGLLGGILGYLLGLGAAYVMSLYLPFAPVLQWQVAVLSIGVAITTGILFGIYPAIKAAKKDPIESLRY